MTVQNPAPWPASPAGQPPHAQHPQLPASAPPVAQAAPPRPPRPPLAKAAAARARLAGGVGGGIAWLGLGIAQAALVLLLLPLLVGTVVFGIGFAISGDSASATAGVWPRLLDWLGSPAGIALLAAIPFGVVVWLLGLWLSTRMLRGVGLPRPVAVTWAGFGLAAAANVLLSGLGSATVGPFMGGLPMGGLPVGGPHLGLDRGDRDWERDWADDFPEEGRVDLDPDLLERIADPGQLVALAGPWVALGTLASLVVPIVIGVFTWWWMAHAMRAPGQGDAAAARLT